MREGWTDTTLGEVAKRTVGRTPPRGDKSYWTDSDERPFCTIADMSGQHVQGGREGVTERAEREGKAKRISAGTLLLSFKLSIGRVGFAARDLFPNEAIAAIYPVEEVDQAFLALALEHVDWSEYGNPAVKGKTLNRESLDAVRLSLPPIEEQRRIVDLMSHVDDALRSCDALVSAEGALLDAASEALVFSAGFPLMKVGDLAAGKRGLVGGPFGSSLVGRDYVETGVPVIRGQNLQGRHVSGDFVFVSDEKSQSLHGNQATPGDVVFTQRGTLGQVSLIPDDAYPNYVVSQSQMRLTPDRSIVSAEWVYHVFRSPRMVQRIKRADTSTANPHINLGILRGMDVPIPSVEMQAQVCSQLNAIEASIEVEKTESESLKSARGALLSALLCGTHPIPASYDEFIRDEGAA